jgi:hypothetical protein
MLKIKELGSKDQDVANSGSTLWDWSVTPLKTGETNLVLRLTLLQDMEGRDLQRDLEALRSEITVSVKNIWSHPARFWFCHWKWVITTVVAAAGVIVAILELS